ncbi:hypothetical protein BGZ70_002946 [Mortierella alpina]|uniref:Coth protein-domain-containing protein n=1 Tax=Mortierella alpina TaxID=64518 RepID=A0A9P6LW93_MORAP|nr:hypothetical protein BGZ70_002946 [Mortierella alpina]
MVRLVLGLAACAAIALADVTFNVVGFREEDADEYGVLINGKVTKLNTNKETYPLWSANVAGVNAPLSYKYVHMKKDGKVEGQEKGERKLPAGAAHTPNEYYNRIHTMHELPPLPQVYENPLVQNSPFFRPGYIGNLFIEGDAAMIKHIHTGGGDFHPKPIHVKVQYIGANEHVKVNNATFNLSGGSAREYSKLAYKLKFHKGNRFLDLGSVKLRNVETDDSFMREMVYVDLLNSLGVHTQQATYVRVFINQKPIGLFIGMEEMKKHWIKKVLHPNVKKTKTGALWKMNSCCGAEGNLDWLGPHSKDYLVGEVYKNILPGNNPKDDLLKDLIVLMEDLKHYEPAKVKDPIAYWEQRMDLNQFLKSMAMEYLTGSSDSFWIKGSNWQIYNDPVTGKWTYLPIDFDDTFGDSRYGPVDSYRKMPKVNSKGFESPMIRKLIIDTPAISKRFEQILKDTVSYLYKPQAVGPRMDAYYNMIADDVAWDRKLPRVFPAGKSHNFKFSDLAQGVTDVKYFIKQRTGQVEKDLKFKALPGVPTKVGYHVMNKQLSPYGIIPKEAKVAAPATNIEHKPNNYNGNTADVPTPADNEANVGDASTQGDKLMNSAELLRGKWAALTAVVAIVVLAI